MIEKTQIANNPQVTYRDNNSSVSNGNSVYRGREQSVGLPDCRYMGGLSFLSSQENKIQDSQEKAKYKELSAGLDRKTRKKLENLLVTGKLLDKNSNTGKSTLTYLYEIYRQPRVAGLNNVIILTETINRLDNPFIITQKFGKIPDFQLNQILAQENSNPLTSIGLDGKVAPQFNNAQYVGPVSTLTAKDINSVESGTCVAASMEFNLADKKPAEYARFVAGLTSPALAVTSLVDYKDIAPTVLESADLLSKFEVKHKEQDWDEVQVTLRPDRNAIVRARAESTYVPQPGQPPTRSTIDTLLQSTFMQTGSASSYNTLNDIRTGGFNLDNKGLTEFEKTFTESLIDDSGGKTSMTYQIVDGNKNIQGYTTDFETTKKHLLDSLNAGSNVIIGITEFDHVIKTNDGRQYHVIASQPAASGLVTYQCVDDSGKHANIGSQNVVSESKEIIGGHEMTVIGTKVRKNGELYFVCNDTDDNYSGSIEISAKELIPKIHHAGIPNKVLDLSDQPAIGDLLLNEYINMKNQPPQQAVPQAPVQPQQTQVPQQMQSPQQTVPQAAA